MESFWALDEIVELGEAQAETALRADPQLYARLRAASSAPLRRRPLPRGDRAGHEATDAGGSGGDDARLRESARTLWSKVRRG